MNYYNEIDPRAADEIDQLIEGGLIPDGKVDRRSIADVQPADIRGFHQVHFFCGIAGWPLALQLARWPDDVRVGTGSCPCQPFSTAGKQKGSKDSRHLWPEMFRLVVESGIGIWFGEQVASAVRHDWLDGVCADLEGASFSVGAVVYGAHSVGLPHVRQRLWWVADSAVHGLERVQRRATAQVQKNRAPKALAAWNRTSDPFRNWKKLLAKSDVRRVAHGVSSTLDIRPRLHAYGNAIAPEAGSQFIQAFMEIKGI